MQMSHTLGCRQVYIYEAPSPANEGATMDDFAASLVDVNSILSQPNPVPPPAPPVREKRTHVHVSQEQRMVLKRLFANHDTDPECTINDYVRDSGIPKENCKHLLVKLRKWNGIDLVCVRDAVACPSFLLKTLKCWRTRCSCGRP